MKTTVLICATSLFALSLAMAASPKEEVTSAAKKLADQPNYSWKTTVVVPEGSQFRPGPTEGKTEKDGFTVLKSSFGDNTTETVLKGDKGAITNQDGAWESLKDVESQEGFARFRAAMARNFKAPATQAAELAAGAKELKKEGDSYSGELTEEAAKALLTFGRRGGAGGASASEAKGQVKFWLTDGALTKYEFKVKGTVSFNNNDREVDRTSTVQIQDVGTTKVNVPEGAKKNLG